MRRQFDYNENYDHGLDDEYLALMALLSIGERFYAGGAPLSLKELARIFNDQESLAVSSLEALQKCGLVTQVAANGVQNIPRFMPSRPFEQIRVKDALACLRHGRRLNFGRLLGDTNHFSNLVGQLVEHPASEWQDLSVLEFLHRSSLQAGQISILPDKIQAHPGITFFSR